MLVGRCWYVLKGCSFAEELLLLLLLLLSVFFFKKFHEDPAPFLPSLVLLASLLASLACFLASRACFFASFLACN